MLNFTKFYSMVLFCKYIGLSKKCLLGLLFDVHINVFRLHNNNVRANNFLLIENNVFLPP